MAKNYWLARICPGLNVIFGLDAFWFRLPIAICFISISHDARSDIILLYYHAGHWPGNWKMWVTGYAHHSCTTYISPACPPTLYCI